MTLDVDILVLTSTQWKLLCTFCLFFICGLSSVCGKNDGKFEAHGPVDSRDSNVSSLLKNSTVNYEPHYNGSYDLVEHQSEIGFPETNPYPRLQTAIFRKCFCGIEEVWTDGKCVSVKSDIIFPILQSTYPETEITADLDLSSLTIGNVACSKTHSSVKLQGGLFIFENGDLYSEPTDTFFSPNNYCFEFVDDNNVINTIARVCIAPPKVQSCSRDIKANYFKTAPLNILFGSNLLKLQTFEVTHVEKLNCKGEEVETLLRLEDEREKVSFHYVSSEIQALWHPSGPVKEPQIFSSEEFCLTEGPRQNPGSVSLKFCYDDPLHKHERRCRASVCVRKCCHQNHVYDYNLRRCVPSSNSQSSRLFSFHDIESHAPVSAPQPIHVEYSFPWCTPKQLYIVDPAQNPADDFFLLKNGSLYISLSKLAMPPSLYCVDTFMLEGSPMTTKAISCFLEEALESPQSCKEVHRILYPVLIVISCAFLAITLLVYGAIPELHSKLHGKSLLSHVSSLLMAFLCQLIVSWSSKSLSMTGCKIMALGNQVSFLWAFFWLNVMCFDIWWTLKSMSLVPETGESSRQRFALYSLYAWGCPIIIAFFTAVMEFLPSSVARTGLIRPGFGLRGCWFQDVKSTWIYFHGFTLSLYVLNIFYFFHVAAILISSQRSTEGILRTTRKQHKERVYLYLKLFVVMGITWICEVASWQEGTCEYWILTDIINSLQGVMIFFIFMCNKKVYQKIQARGIPIFRRMKTLVRGPTSLSSVDTRQNSSSQRTTQTSDEPSRRLSSSVPPVESQLIKKP